MSRLDKLIQEFCPNGVEFKRLDEIFNTRNGYTPSKSNSSYWNGDTCIPWFRMEDIREHGNILIDSIQHVTPAAIKGELFPENSIIIATSATIGEHALVKVKSLANQRFTYLVLKEEYQYHYDIKFLYYYCYKLDEWCLTHLNQSSFASVDMGKFYAFTFPIPPLEVQREIVRILDNFTELTLELTLELTARKKQYEYYRNKLLTYDNAIPMEKLGTTCEMKAGKAIPSHLIFAKKSKDTPIKCYGGNGIRGYVKDPNEEGCFPIIGRQGALCGNVNYAEGQFYATEHAVVIKSKGQYISRFLYHLLTHMNLNQYKSAGAQPGLAVKNIEELVAPVPTIEQQKKIIDILDNFEAICSDWNISLPAEIEARQKQYEYYRDKLLTFKELGE